MWLNSFKDEEEQVESDVQRDCEDEGEQEQHLGLMLQAYLWCFKRYFIFILGLFPFHMVMHCLHYFLHYFNIIINKNLKSKE